MKKLFLLFLLVCSVNSFASTTPLLIVNNTQYYVNYQLITFPPIGSGVIPQINTFGVYQGLITLAPYSSINYNIPGAQGLPYNMVNTWTVANGSTLTNISGANAYASYGSRFRWGKFKFSITTQPYNALTSVTSGNVGPMGDAMSFLLENVSVVWTQNGSSAIVTISMG